MGIRTILPWECKDEVTLIILNKDVNEAINELPEDVFLKIRNCWSVRNYIICPAMSMEELNTLRKLLNGYGVVRPYPCENINLLLKNE